MGLVTRCPACKTLFRVVQDQLEISSGWVRCGLCGESFDSSVELYQAGGPHDSTSTPPPEEAIESAESMAQRSPLPEPDISDTQKVSTASGIDSPLRDGHINLASKRFSDHLTLAQNSFEAAREPGFLVPEASVEPSRRSSGLIQAALGFSLLVGLLCQVVFHERARMEAHLPAFQALWQNVCTLSACDIAPLQDRESLAIESSSFVATANGSYRLSVTVKNVSAVTLATPAIELTLTDALEQTVVRKVLTPGDLNSTASRLLPGGQWTGSANLDVDLASGGGLFTGYHVVAFYP